MKKSKTLVTIVVTLVAGYLVGVFFGMPGVDSPLLSGDIGKVSKYSKQVAEDAKAFQERLENDPEFCEATIGAVSVMDARINKFKDLTDSTQIVASNIPELKECMAEMAELNEFAVGAKFQADSTLASLAALLDGKKGAAYQYEQMAQNAVIAYMMLDKQDDVVRDFVSQIDRYVANKSADEVKDLVNLRNKWVVFSATSAAINDSKSDFAYWSEKGIVDLSSALGSQVVVNACPILSNEQFIMGYCKTMGNQDNPLLNDNFANDAIQDVKNLEIGQAIRFIQNSDMEMVQQSKKLMGVKFKEVASQFQINNLYLLGARFRDSDLKIANSDQELGVNFHESTE